jgi:nucleoside-diphosphate-sugar epimerase
VRTWEIEKPLRNFHLGSSHLSNCPNTFACSNAPQERSDRPPRSPATRRRTLIWADISKAQKLLGYRPETAMEEELKAFVAWCRAANLVQQASMALIALHFCVLQ